MKITYKQLDYIITKIIEGECLLCEIYLNEEKRNGIEHIPLCKKHCKEYLDKEAMKLIKK